MGLVEIVKSLVNRQPPIAMDRLREARPKRNPVVTWIEAEEGIVLDMPLAESTNRFSQALARWSKSSPTKKFELEPVGAYVWELCDGVHTVDGIARKLRSRYRMNRLEADASLAAFLQMLSQRGLISIMVKKK
ncbi:MAG: PqqD family protein [Fimbriimonas sp.]